MLDGWWIATLFENGGPAALVSWVVVVIGSIVLHELAHGWAAIRLGDRTPIETGHMTWNPIVHMGLPSLACFALFGFAWGAMPVDSGRLRGRYADLLVSAAGPLMNVALAAAGIVLAGAWLTLAGQTTASATFQANALFFFRAMAFLNVFLALFNLLPVFPLDGGRILAEIWPAYRDFITRENGQWILLGGLLLFFWFGAGPILAVATEIAGRGSALVAGLF